MKKIFYNITIIIEHAAHKEWLKWMTEVHVPEVMKTKMFLESKICRLLGTDETDGLTYSFHYIAPNMETFEKYKNEFAPALKKDHDDKFEGKFVAFRSVMEVGEEF